MIFVSLTLFLHVTKQRVQETTSIRFVARRIQLKTYNTHYYQNVYKAISFEYRAQVKNKNII